MSHGKWRRVFPAPFSTGPLSPNTGETSTATSAESINRSLSEGILKKSKWIEALVVLTLHKVSKHTAQD